MNTLGILFIIVGHLSSVIAFHCNPYFIIANSIHSSNSRRKRNPIPYFQYYYRSGTCTNEEINDRNFKTGIKLSSSSKSLNEKTKAKPKAKIKTWDIQYRALKRYKNKFGNCLIPQKYKPNPALGEWVSNQRTMYKAYKKKRQQILEQQHQPATIANVKKTKFTNMKLKEKRIQALNELGFVWHVKETKWSNRYNELKEYQRIHGDTLVPSSYKTNPALGKWVALQRRYYSLLQENDNNTNDNDTSNNNSNNPLTLERIEALNDIQFSWNMNSEGGVANARWEKRFQELCQYREENNGKIDVSLDYESNPQLGIWVHNQRLHYKIFIQKQQIKEEETTNDGFDNEQSIDGINCILNQEKIDKLQQIGFIFNKSDEKWNQRYNELLEYKFKHGDCMVPEYYKENIPLGSWVVHQRKQYRNVQYGRIDRHNSSLISKRIELLDSIGFCWSIDNYNWFQMLEQLKCYYSVHDSFDIPSADKTNAKLRDWVKYQRNEYKKIVDMEERMNQNDDDYQENLTLSKANDYLVPSNLNGIARYVNTTGNESKISSIAPERKQALDDIGFVWESVQTRIRMKSLGRGRTKKEWKLLFDKMIEKGISSKAKAKEHIFDGEERFVDGIAHRLDEDDLLELWNSEEDW